MRLTFFLTLTIFGIVVIAKEYYSDLYDNIDVAKILASERLFKPYLACLLEKGSCTADARAFKVILPDAIVTNCERCNPRQKEIAKTISQFFRSKKPVEWQAVIEKYDPDRRYINQFEKFLDSE